MIEKITTFFRSGQWEKIRLKTVFIFAGISSTVWFLVRVIPKPQRAAYPCMRAAAPVMSSFVLWCLSLMGMLTAWRKARAGFLRSRYVYAALFGFLFLIFVVAFAVQNSEKLNAMFTDQAVIPNAPLGIAKGIYPGRVVWVYNPEAAKWTGAGYYWAATVNSQDQYNRTFTAGINALSGGSSDADSWDKIFRWFNANHKRTDTGYQPGDKIAIKINMNNSEAPALHAGNVANANPQTCVACVQSLVNAGVPQNEIWIGDPSRAVTDNVYNTLRAAFPDIHIVDYFGNNGRETTGVVRNVFPNTDVIQNQSACFYDARYIINIPLLKGHEGQAITFGSKNFYGINGIKPVWTDNGGKHPGWSALTNYMTNEHFGGKTILWLMDAMYPTRDVGGVPATKWTEAPFNGRPASSYIMSLDGVAEESVSLDFFFQHYPEVVNNNGGMNNAEGYMIAAAKAGAGVHEHWNNNIDRKYTKNLNPQAATGIELIQVTVLNTNIKHPVNDKNGIRLYSIGNGYARLSMPDVSIVSALDLELFSLNGRSVLKKSMDTISANLIDLSRLPKGVYLYKLRFWDNQLSGKIKIAGEK
jgi:hypothetical protein